MKRQLLIVTNDGYGTDSPIPNVHLDEKNYIEYFKSLRGGVWENKEILSTSFRCHEALKKFLTVDCINCDFILFVFSGHGYYDSELGRMIELADNVDIPVNTIRNWVSFTRCLFISDSCAGLIPHEAIEKAFSNTLRENLSIKNLYRNKYNDRVMSVPIRTFTAGYAASRNENVDDTENGGVYSSSLINCAKKIKFNGDKSVLDLHVASFSYIHSLAKDLVINITGGNQHPQCETPRFPKQLPFVVY